LAATRLFLTTSPTNTRRRTMKGRKEVAMRKTLLTVVASCALLAVAPASALAHGRGHHRSHHARAHHRTFGADQGMGQNTGTSPSAGTVQSFTGGVLTIALTNGSTVSGQVSNFTRIICLAAQPTGMQGSGSWQGGSWQGHHDGWNGGGDNWNGGGNQGQSDNDGDNDDQGSQSCDTSALTMGAVVQEAELSISGAGATWDKIVLAPTSSSSTSPPSSTSSSSSSSWS
jgi:hypothetical protein